MPPARTGRVKGRSNNGKEDGNSTIILGSRVQG